MWITMSNRWDRSVSDVDNFVDNSESYPHFIT
jgi:hypothetical protein